MNIIVLCGGLSKERDVSITSGKSVAEALRRCGHKAVLVDLFFGYTMPYEKPADVFDAPYFDDLGGIETEVPDLDSLVSQRQGGYERMGSNVLEVCAASDIVFMALHGDDGEDGKVQAMFDLAGIKYTGTGSFGSSLAMNKDIAKQLFIKHGINTPNGITFAKSEKKEFDNSGKAEFYPNIGFPCVVKPCNGGSSVGTTIVENYNDYGKALDFAFKYDSVAIIEQYIKGRECDVGIIAEKALPAIEICPKSGFFDYKNKYQSGMTDEYCPADLSDDIELRLIEEALKVFAALKLEVYARMDFIVDKDGVVWCLEANTLPGLTPASLMPKEAAADGLTYDEFCELIISESMKKYI